MTKKQHRHMIAGKPVFDAKKKIEITISADDVAKGARRSQADCAAALSIQRCIPGAKGARVCIGRTYVDMGDHWMMYNTPDSLKHEVIAHDRDGRFQPDDYYLNPISPSEISRRGKRTGSNKPGARDRGSKNRTPSKSRMKPHLVQGIRARGANV
jgi:hypothetical protein